jgi:heptosyltransferase-2
LSEAFDRLLVFAPNWLGDAVMAVPCLGAIRRHYPRLALAVAARSHLAPLFEMVDGVDEVVRLEPAGRPGGWLAAWRDARRLRAARFDVAILLPNSFRAAWIARRAGIAERWGYAADLRTRMLTRAVPRLRGGHQVQYYQRLLDGLGIRSDFDTGHRGSTSSPRPEPVEGRTPDTGRSDLPTVRIDVPGDVRDWARAMLASRGRKGGDHLVGMAPGAAYGSAKQWPPDRFAQLAIDLAQAGVTTVLMGSAGDRVACDEIARAAAGGCINLTGATDLRQLAAVMAECRSFVSNDSGAMHLAAAVGVPVVAIFGPTNEHETSPLPIAVKTDGDEFQNVAGIEIRPDLISRAHAIVAADVWCRPCMLRECPLDHGCMTRIDVARVKAEVMKRSREIR